MIQSLVIQNFKAIKHLELEFTPFTVLIGGNSCGKSSVLQALDLVRAFATRDIDEYLQHERGWLIDDIRSQFNDKPVCIDIRLRLNINGTSQNISWVFTIDKKADKIFTQEFFFNRNTNKYILRRGFTEQRTEKPILENTEKFLLKSSYLKLIDENDPQTGFPEELRAVKKFFTQSSSYELLTPDRMREKSSRGEVRDIGMGGEKLAAYINSMSAGNKSKLNRMFSEFVGYPAKTTTETKRPGWVDLFISESFPENKAKIKASHISDGSLRLLGLIAASLPEEKIKQAKLSDSGINMPDSGFILLDEIEDGINPYLTEKVIALLRTVISEYNKQIIITTHSPVMLNHFDQKEIIFMWRDSEGQIQAKPMFATEGMRDTLDCFNPGEVWLNYSKDEILDLINPSQKEEQN
ncbi:MAG: AAA family ATPase [Firmicutes bacterium]|nr:AAA family ATPase [Bacillota bacterium]